MVTVLTLESRTKKVGNIYTQPYQTETSDFHPDFPHQQVSRL